MSLLNKLCFYNDKGIAYSQDDEEKAAQMRNKYLQQIDYELSVLGKDKFPSELLVALENNELGKDGTGKYYDIAKSTKV